MPKQSGEEVYAGQNGKKKLPVGEQQANLLSMATFLGNSTQFSNFKLM